MPDTGSTPARLRQAALRIAKGRHPDQAWYVSPDAFDRRKDHFTSVHGSGGELLVSREEAEAEAEGAV